MVYHYIKLLMYLANVIISSQCYLFKHIFFAVCQMSKCRRSKAAAFTNHVTC